MTDRSHGSSDEDDLSTLPFLNDAERAEHEWLLARETDPDAAAPSAKVAGEYDRLEGMLSTQPEPALSERWHEELMKQASASRARKDTPARRRAPLRWVAAATSFAVAAVLVLYVKPDKPSDTTLSAGLGYWIAPAGTQRGSTSSNARPNAEDALVGDRLVSSPLRLNHEVVRIYRLGTNPTLVAKCPGGEHCIKTTSGEHIDVSFDVPGRYLFVSVDDEEGRLASAPDSKDEFLDAVQKSNAISHRKQIAVE